MVLDCVARTVVQPAYMLATDLIDDLRNDNTTGCITRQLAILSFVFGEEIALSELSTTHFTTRRGYINMTRPCTPESAPNDTCTFILCTQLSRDGVIGGSLNNGTANVGCIDPISGDVMS